MMRRLALLALPAVLAGTLVACGGASDKSKAGAEKAEGTPLATVGDDAITVEAYRQKLMAQSPFLRARYDSLERKKEFLDNMVRFELLAREAERRGFDEDPDVQETMKKVMVQKLMRQEFEEVEPPAPTDEELRAFYEAHIDDYVKPERVRVAHVFVADEGDRAAAKKEAAALLADLKANAKDPRAFQNMAREKSDDAERRAAGGDLGYQSDEELTAAWGAEVAKAAFAMENVGELSAVVEGDKGFHVLRLTGRQKAVNRTFDEVRRNIDARLKQDRKREAYEAFMEGLRQKEKVVIDEAALEEIDVASTGIAPAPAAAGPHGGHGHPARPAARPANTEQAAQPQE